MSQPPPIGVLALQGDVREHLRLLSTLGVPAVAVRRPAELAGVAGLVLPGGESTTMIRLARIFDLVEPVHAVFIRAPWVESVGSDVEVLATVETGPAAGRIVAVRQGPLMATSFHPEVGGDSRIHRMFVELVAQHLHV